MSTLSFHNAYSELNQRTLGWLTFLHQKATTPDDWSEDGQPQVAGPDFYCAHVQLSTL